MEGNRAALERADKSLFFLTVLLGSLLLSWQALWRERQGLARGTAADVSRLRLAAGALVAVSLSVFFCLALENRRQGADKGGMDALAALLVLLAALLRLARQLDKAPPSGEAGGGADGQRSFFGSNFSLAKKV